MTARPQPIPTQQYLLLTLQSSPTSNCRFNGFVTAASCCPTGFPTVQPVLQGFAALPPGPPHAVGSREGWSAMTPAVSLTTCSVLHRRVLDQIGV